MLVALVGGEHLLTLSYQRGLAYVTGHQDTFGEAFSQEPNVGERLAPALLLVYCFHGRMCSWMMEQWKYERPVAPLSFKLGFENLIHFGQMKWLPNIRNIPELPVALKTASRNTQSTRNPRSSSERPSTGEQQVCVLNKGMDPRLLPCTALGKINLVYEDT